MDHTHDHVRRQADLVTGGLDRRRFLQVGGLTVATAAVFAACGSGGSGSSAPGDTTTTTVADTTAATGSTATDIDILRTASSIEQLAVDVYQKAIDSGLLTTAAVAEAATLFQTHHKAHADLFKGATKKLGGTAFDKANPVVLKALQPQIDALKDEKGAVALALAVEQAATATYVSAAGAFHELSLNQATMSVGAVAARHVAVLAAVLGQPQVPKAFATKDGAITPGTGV
jgi:rubrerythrin